MLQRTSINTKKSLGFTLIELVTVIVLLAVMAVGISSFMGLATQTFVNVSARDELISTARFAIERLNREIRNAVPNSIRTRNNTTRQCLEFMPIVASTIYTDIPVAPEAARKTISVIPFVNTDGDPYSCLSVTGNPCVDLVAVYPLTSGDVFSQGQFDTGKIFKILPFTPPANQTEWTINLADAVTFTADSPTNRLYVVKSPVSYCVRNGELRRYANHGATALQELAGTSDDSLMAENIAPIDEDDLPFDYQSATLQRNGLVKIKLDFVRDDEHIVFNHEIHLANTP